MESAENAVSVLTRWALSMLSLNGKKASELRETPFRVVIHSFLSAYKKISNKVMTTHYLHSASCNQMSQC